MTSPGGAGLYGMTDEQLVAIINATNEHIDHMHQLNTNVQTQAANYLAANNSTSGQIMNTRLGQWTEDFHRVVGNLNELNEKVHMVRQTNANARDTATTTAQGFR